MNRRDSGLTVNSVLLLAASGCHSGKLPGNSKAFKPLGAFEQMQRATRSELFAKPLAEIPEAAN